MDTVSEFHVKAPQATANEGLSQGPYAAAGAGFEPTTLRSTAIDSTNEPPRPMMVKITLHMSVVSAVHDNATTPMSLNQWCTTFFGQGTLFGFLNSLGATQVQRLNLHPVADPGGANPAMAPHRSW